MRSTLLLLLVFSSKSSFAQPGVSVVGFSESRHAVTALSPGGDLTLPVAHRQLDIEFPGGAKRKERGDLTVVYDPQTGYYFWRYFPRPSGAETMAFLSALESGAERVFSGPDALVDFFMNDRLYAREHIERATSLEAAEEMSTEEVRRKATAPGTTAIGMTVTEVLPTSKTTYDSITPDFACAQVGQPGFSQNCPAWKPSILSISHEGGMWRLVIRNRWDQEEILDSQFRLVSARRLPDPNKEP